MITLWIVLAVIALFAFAFIKIEHHAKIIKVAILVFVVLLLYFSMTSLFSSGAVDLSSPRGIVNAVYLYIGWLGETVSNVLGIGKDTVGLVGNAIKVNDDDVSEFGGTNFSFRDKIADIIRKD